MKACSKCGAENPDSAKHCGRCQIPLPNTGAGETLPGGPSAARAAAAAGGVLRQETLFGISPEQMAGKLPERRPRAPAEPTPRSPPEPSRKVEAPATGAKPAPAGQTFFGVAPPGVYPARRHPEAGPYAAVPRTGGGASPAAEASAADRTLLGVVPEMARAVAAAAREQTPAAPLPARSRGAMPTHPQAPPHPPPWAPEAARPEAAVVAGGSLPAARRAAPARTVFEAATPSGTVRSRASDGIAPAGPGARAPIPLGAESLDVEPEDEQAPAAPALPMHARTHLGVAIPGIAPLQAGGSQPAPAAPGRAGLLDETQLQPDSVTAAPFSARQGLPRGAFVLLGSALALLFAAAAFALLWKAQSPLSVAISADASGRDRIDLVCEECPDGSLVSLKEARAEIAGRKAYLTLPEPLPLGENRVIFGLQRPGEPEPEAIAMTLPPLDYRIRPDTSTLVGDQPRLTLKIAAIPGSNVDIAGQPVGLDAGGNGVVAVEVAGELIGAASEVTTLEQSIAYRIAPPSGKTYEGQLSFKIGVTPLLLEAPGMDTVTDLERFMLAGKTTKGAELFVAGTTIAVDASGRFAQLMSIDSVGETRVTVRATEPGLAPRFVSFRLQRVENLEAEAALRRQKALRLADVTRRIADHVGSSVVVSGRIEEVRMDGHQALVLLSSDAGCDGRSCLVRLVYGGLRKLSRGDTISAIGRLQRAVPEAAGSSGEVPEIDVSLLL